MISGLSPWELAAFIASFTVIALSTVWNVTLYWLAGRRTTPLGDGGAVCPLGESDFDWVFLVPALNEEVTIADSVARLLKVECSRPHIVVVDDGSTDRTPDVLAELARPELLVLRRELPDAQQGKAAALNDVWRRLPDLVPGLDPHRTIVCIVDADGRLDPGAPGHVAERFADDDVGGVQVRVRIYNRGTALTRAQDIEFGVYGELYQAARSFMGTAGMGGNGQFNRLAALDSVAEDADGPWRHTLTEDQDIGLRLLDNGWKLRHDNRASVDQQGVSNLRRLLRQRTRWAQGNLQAMTHLRRVPRFEVSRAARFDLLWALLQPVAAAVVGFGVFAALWAFVVDDVGLVPSSIAIVALFFFFGFGGIVVGAAARSGRGPTSWLVGLGLGVVYSAYTWLLWPVLARAAWRQARAKGTWAKTEREAIS